MSILHLISQDSFIVVNQKLIDIFGFYEAGIVGLFGSVHNYNESECHRKGVSFDGWFYVTYDKIYQRLKLTEDKAKKPINNLEKAGIFLTKKKGVPCRKYFKFNKQKLIELLVFDEVESSTPKNGGLETGKIGSKKPKNSVTSTRKSQSQEGGKTGSNNKTNKKTPSSSENDRENLEKKCEEEGINLEIFDKWWKYNFKNDWKDLKGEPIRDKLRALRAFAKKPENQIAIVQKSLTVLENPKISDLKQEIHKNIPAYRAALINCKIEEINGKFIVFVSQDLYNKIQKDNDVRNWPQRLRDLNIELQIK